MKEQNIITAPMNNTPSKTITTTLDECTPDELNKIYSLIKNKTTHDFSLYKTKTICRRIYKRMHALQINAVADYIYYIHQAPDEIILLFNELLINVTNFFRDPDAFEKLKKALLEQLSQHKDSCFRVWVPGCSTGEEAYSIAIILQECMNLLKVRFEVQIFATDIDEEAIATAREGIFSSNITNDVSPERLHTFFTKNGNTYKIDMSVRKTIIFAVQNIIIDPPFTKLHLLSCRNLLIYLTSALQKKILPLFHYSLKAHGLLFIGPAENIGDVSDCFTVVSKRWNIYGRIAGVGRLTPTLSLFPTNKLPDIKELAMTKKLTGEMEPHLSHLVKNILAKKYTPAFIILNEKGDIVYIYGRTSKFLEFASGQVHLHFMDMIHPELKSPFHAAIQRASAQRKEITLHKIRFIDQNIPKYINATIQPIIETDVTQQKLLLIIIEDTVIHEHEVSANHALKADRREDPKIIQLEHDLIITKESLQTTIEELETSNEELKSSNEELQSTNEELRSLNEELTTVNSELENRIEQLSSANDDIKNLLDNTEIATIFLDKDLCIKRFTPKSTFIINLIPSDVGRPISHIVSNLKYKKLIEDARTVLKTVEPFTTDAMDKNGHWYEIKIIPYRTVTNLIDGVIITFLNVHEKKQAEHQLKTFESDINMLQSLNQTLDDITLILDHHEKIIWVNQPFLTQFKIKNNDIIGKSIDQLTLTWDKHHFKKIAETLLHNKALVQVSTLEISPHKTVNVTAHKISTSTLLFVLN
jgi:two-component system CheB/CheR fusion protein